jgi:hypothetical protein
LGFIVDETEAMQQGGHAAGGVGDAKLLLDPGGDVLGRQVEMRLDMRIQGRQLGVGERAVAPLVSHLQQAGQTALPIAPKMVAYRVGVDQQDRGHLLCRPAARQRHDRLDAVGLALVARTPVGGTQLGELFGGEGIVEHGLMVRCVSRLR